jgi:DNA topoisomerase-2
VYVPIVPMVVINGVQGGIGTGWSSTIPPHNIKDVVAWIKAWLNEEEVPVLQPYFRGFRGTVTVEGKKVITQGLFHEDKKRYVVTEIPIGRRMLSISKFKAKLDALDDAGLLKSIDNQSTENLTHFSFLWNKPEDPPTMEKLGLVDSTYTSNMVLFNEAGKLKKYDTVDEIVEEWCGIRFDQYNKRKEGTLAAMNQEAKVLYNKIRFIEQVLNDKIIFKDKDEETLVKELETAKFDALPDYGYLLNLSVLQLTKKSLSKLHASYKKLLEASKEIAATSIKDMWIRELDELLKAYDKWYAEQNVVV